MLGFGAVLGGNFVGVMAFIGALLVSFGVLLLANIKGSATSSKLILAGMALSAVCSSFSNFIIYIANDKTGMQSVTYWLLGSLAGAKWETDIIIPPNTAPNPSIIANVAPSDAPDDIPRI